MKPRAGWLSGAIFAFWRPVARDYCPTAIQFIDRKPYLNEAQGRRDGSLVAAPLATKPGSQRQGLG